LHSEKENRLKIVLFFRIFFYHVYDVWLYNLVTFQVTFASGTSPRKMGTQFCRSKRSCNSAVEAFVG
jgi:hypothetical protein